MYRRVGRDVAPIDGSRVLVDMFACLHVYLVSGAVNGQIENASHHLPMLI
jgi:hypothetical protein